jgi:hypothetical protein
VYVHMYRYEIALFFGGANPMTASHNSGVVKIYNATSSQERFENKNIFF